MEVERRVDQVLRAPRGERWPTLINQISAARTLDGLVDRFARSEAELTNARADARALRDALDTAQRELEKTRKALDEERGVSLRECANVNNACLTIDSLRKELGDMRTELANARADNSVLREALTIAKKAKESWPDDIKTIESLRKQLATQVEAFANAKESWRSAQANYEHVAKERDQLRQELSATQINLHDHASGLAAVVKERDEAKAEVKSLKEELDQAHVRIRELNLGIARAQDVRQDRQTDVRLFLELIHLGRTVDDARAILAAAEDIRKNGLTPQT